MELGMFTLAGSQIKKLCSEKNADVWYLSFPTNRDDITGTEPPSSAKLFCYKQVVSSSEAEKTLAYRAVEEIGGGFLSLFSNQVYNRSH